MIVDDYRNKRTPVAFGWIIQLQFMLSVYSCALMAIMSLGSDSVSGFPEHPATIVSDS